MPADPSSVDGRSAPVRFQRMGFDKFRELAVDPSLSEAERIGAAKGHREGFGEAIWHSIIALLPALRSSHASILDIGPGCGELARRMIALAETQSHSLTMIDHKEMLDQLPASPAVKRIGGRFPDAMPSPVEDGAGSFDVVIAYSVLASVIVDANPFSFLDAAMSRLKPGGRLLVGDVPNASKLRRFLSSEAGAAYHRVYMRTEQAPDVPSFELPVDRIDDGAMIGMVMRARLAGYDAYLLPQPDDLPFANRREDLLILRP